jgi:hypothetical protein
MVQGRRRGLVHTKEVSLEYELGRVQKERGREVDRVSDAEKTDDRVLVRVVGVVVPGSVH